MLSVMKLLSFEHTLHLVRYGVVWVVSKIRRDLIRGSQRGGASPTRNVQGLLVRCLLRHLHWVNCSHYGASVGD